MSIEDLKSKLDDKWIILNKLHKSILSIDPKIEYHVFPIYIGYYIKDNPVAMVYFQGKFVSSDLLDVGFALKEKPKNSNFVDAKYMKYPGINYSTKINSLENITKEFINTIKLIRI